MDPDGIFMHETGRYAHTQRKLHIFAALEAWLISAKISFRMRNACGARDFAGECVKLSNKHSSPQA
jgi:hypothetical protein